MGLGDSRVAIFGVTLLFLVSMLGIAFALSSGPNNSGTIINLDNSASNNRFWVNAVRASTSNNSYASVVLNGGSANDRQSDFLKATNFGFAIPLDATILGIEVTIERAQSCVGSSCTSVVVDSNVRLVKDGNIVGIDHADRNTAYSNSDTSVKYGSSSDLWGTTWTPAQINNNLAGLVFASQRNIGGDRNVRVDAITMNVYYGLPADTTPPVISGTPSDRNVEATSSAGAVVTFDLPTALDAVDGNVAVSCLPVSGSTFALGNNVVTCTAKDSSDNNSTTSFVVNVLDTTKPVLIVPELSTFEATSTSGAVVDFNVTAADIVDGSDEVICDPVSGSLFAIGSTSVTCLATDAAGNTDSVSFKVGVVDLTPPVITVPDSIAKEATSAGGAVVDYVVTVSDAASNPITASCVPASGSLFALETTIVNCTATDDADISSTNSFSVTVSDNTAPSISVPKVTTFEATSSEGAVVTFSDLIATDVVDGTDEVTCTPEVGKTFGIGVTDVNCSSVDKVFAN